LQGGCVNSQSYAHKCRFPASRSPWSCKKCVLR